MYTIAYRVHVYTRASLIHSPNPNPDSYNRISPKSAVYLFAVSRLGHCADSRCRGNICRRSYLRSYPRKPTPTNQRKRGNRRYQTFSPLRTHPRCALADFLSLNKIWLHEFMQQFWLLRCRRLGMHMTYYRAHCVKTWRHLQNRKYITRGGCKGEAWEARPPQSEVSPHSPENEIFGKCKWTLWRPWNNC